MGNRYLQKASVILPIEDTKVHEYMTLYSSLVLLSLRCLPKIFVISSSDAGTRNPESGGSSPRSLPNYTFSRMRTCIVLNRTIKVLYTEAARSLEWIPPLDFGTASFSKCRAWSSIRRCERSLPSTYGIPSSPEHVKTSCCMKAVARPAFLADYLFHSVPYLVTVGSCEVAQSNALHTILFQSLPFRHSCLTIAHCLAEHQQLHLVNARS